MNTQRKESSTTFRFAALTFTFVNCVGALFLAPAHAQFGGISEQEEIKAGQASRAQAIKQYGAALPAIDPRQQRVTRLGRLFANQATRKTIPYSYTVLDNSKVLNAFAAPGGPIFVTSRLVASASNDAELAYVLGHETGHIERKHIVNAVKKQQQVGLAAGILGAIIGGKGGSNDITGALLNTGVALWDRGYSRDNERDADVYGVRAMSKLGFDPRAAISMLGKLGGNSSGLEKYLATHPSPASRQELVNSLIKKENLVQTATKAGGPFLNYGTRRADAAYDEEDNYPATTVSTSAFASNYSQDTESKIFTLQVQPYDGYRVVLAPVASVADFAGGRTETDGRTVTLSRGSSYVRLTQDSASANLNGRSIIMSAPSRIIDGRFYAPVGTVAEGLGGQATYDSTKNAVALRFGERGHTFAIN